MSYYVNPHKFSCPWHPYAQEFGAPNIKWCEETMCTWIAEPSNAWSSLAFIVVALLLEFISKKKRSDFDTQFYVRLVFFVGLGSALYHASLNYLTQLIDYFVMYLVIFWGMAINLKVLGKINDGNKFYFWGGFVSLAMVVTHFFYISNIPVQFLIAVAAVMFLLSEFKVRTIEKRHYKYLATGLGAICLGEVFSILDLERVVCNPNNHIFQAHALWHILSAIGLGAIYLHFIQKLPAASPQTKEVVEDLPEEQIEEQIREDLKAVQQEYEPHSQLEPVEVLNEEVPASDSFDEVTKEHDIQELIAENQQTEEAINSDLEFEETEEKKEKEEEEDPNQLSLFDVDSEKEDKKD